MSQSKDTATGHGQVRPNVCGFEPNCIPIKTSLQRLQFTQDPVMNTVSASLIRLRAKLQVATYLLQHHHNRLQWLQQALLLHQQCLQCTQVMLANVSVS